MLEINQCLRTRSDIRKLIKLDNNLIAMCTTLHGAKLFSHDECNVSANISHEHLNSITSAISFSLNAEFMAFSIKSHIYILHIPSKTVIKTIKIETEIVDLLEFDLESKYIIVATKSGRILQYRYDGSSLLARLYSFDIDNTKKKNTLSIVSSFSFYKNIMACGGDNGTIFTINLHSRANKVIITNTNLRINSICFLDASHIVSGDSKGDLYFNSLKDEKLIKKIETGFTSICQIILMPNPHYIMVVGDANYVAIYDIKKFKLLHSKYIEFDEVVNSVMLADDHTLLVALKNNSVEKVELPNSSELKSLIMHNSLDKAFALAQKDSMLRDTDEYKTLETAYEKVYNQAVEALINQNKKKALEITNMFKYVDSKRDDIQLLFKAFDNYPRFKSLYIEKKYALAYTMSAKFPALQKTFQYLKMEELWRETFKNAQRQIAHGSYENAKTLLNSYVTIAQKRPIIKLVLNHNDNFIKFLKAIESKDFQEINKIAKTNELFTQIPTYKTIEEEMNKAIVDIQKDIDRCDLDLATKKIAKLQNIDSIALKISAQKDECRAVNKLQNAYKSNNFIKCYETLDKHSSLNSTELGSLLQKHWLDIVTKCENIALKGNIKDIKASLGELITLETRRDKIGDLFRLGFHARIKILMAKKTYKKAESTIYSYIDIFGLDNEIISIMKLFENRSKTKLAITQSQESRQTRDSWINSDIIMENK